MFQIKKLHLKIMPTILLLTVNKRITIITTISKKICYKIYESNVNRVHFNNYINKKVNLKHIFLIMHELIIQNKNAFNKLNIKNIYENSICSG